MKIMFSEKEVIKIITAVLEELGITADAIYLDTDSVYVGSLPTTDPEQEGYLYIDNGTLKVSQGE